MYLLNMAFTTLCPWASLLPTMCTLQVLEKLDDGAPPLSRETLSTSKLQLSTHMFMIPPMYLSPRPFFELQTGTPASCLMASRCHTQCLICLFSPTQYFLPLALYPILVPPVTPNSVVASPPLKLFKLEIGEFSSIHLFSLPSLIVHQAPSFHSGNVFIIHVLAVFPAFDLVPILSLLS